MAVTINGNGTVDGLSNLTSGDLTVDTDTLYVDSANNNVGIGTSSPSQKLDVVGNIEVSGGIYLGGTAAANLLDDYEEGTWTPVINPLSGTVTSSSTAGVYRKVGNLVTVSFVAQVTGGTISLINSITGVPFTISSSGCGVARENNVTGLMWELLMGTGGTGFAMFTYNNARTASNNYAWIGSATYTTS